MRIGNPPHPIVVAQPRVRPAETTGLLAKVAPKYPVGKVAALVRKINNGTFGSADTRAAPAFVKPLSFAGSPAKAGASVLRAAPSAERIPTLPPLKSPALVLAITGVVNRGGEGGARSAQTIPRSPTQMQADIPSTLRPSVASLVETFESQTLPQALQAQEIQAIREMREMRRTALARPRSTWVATTRLQRIGTRAQECARKPASPERYAGVLRTNPNEIHPLAMLAGAQPTLSPSPDTGSRGCLSSGDGDWDVMEAFEPFKEPLERMEVALHPALVGEWEASPQPRVELDGNDRDGLVAEKRVGEVDGSPIEARDEDDLWASGWDDDFDSDFDSDAEDRSADESVENPRVQVLPTRTPDSLKHIAIAALLKTAFETRNAANNPVATRQAVAVEQLKLDVVQYRPELEAYDQLPLAARMEGVASLTPAGGKSGSGKERPAFLDAVESFNRETLRKVETVAEVSAGGLEQSFGEGLAEMLRTHKESLLNHSDTDSGVENDADEDWDLYA